MAVREKCNVNDIIKFVRDRRKGWNEHVSRADENRLIKIVRDNIPKGRRDPGRQQKRWAQSWSPTSEVDSP